LRRFSRDSSRRTSEERARLSIDERVIGRSRDADTDAMRTAVAIALYAGVCIAAIAADAAGWQPGFWLIPLATVLVAAEVRRWWLVLMPLWMPAAAAIDWVVDPYPSDMVDNAGSAALLALIFGSVPLAVVTAASIAAAKLVVRMRRQRVAPSA
jgi:hypothetical protein